MNCLTAISHGFCRDFKKNDFTEQPSMAGSGCGFDIFA